MADLPPGTSLTARQYADRQRLEQAVNAARDALAAQAARIEGMKQPGKTLEKADALAAELKAADEAHSAHVAKYGY